MIFDCYTHVWESADQLGRCLPPRGTRDSARLDASLHRAGPARHLAASEPVTTTVVVGFTSRYLDADIPNEQIAAYTRQHPGRLIPFAGIDPSDPKRAVTELRRAVEEWAMPGIAVSPAAQGFHPADSRAMAVYAEAAKLGMPVLFHTGVHMTPTTRLEYAQPVLLDQIARDFPSLKIVIAHLGFPWVNETMTLLGKHANVFAETSWVVHNPWQAYQALMAARECGVMEKLLFGSGFPCATASAGIEALYSINHLCHGTSLPTIPREQIRGVVERDGITMLGLKSPRPEKPQNRTTVPAMEEAGEPG